MLFEGMDYQGACIRPPSEANSILMQATLGCSHNKCTFCETFKTKRFTIKDQAIWERDLDFASRRLKGIKRLFIMDGDAFIMPMKRWEWLLTNIAEKLPWVERISTYANAKGVALKSDADLARLRELGLSFIYYGVESGHPEVLARIKKGADPDKLAREAIRLRRAGQALSITIINGLAGPELSREHARATAELMNRIEPEYIGALTLQIIPGTPLFEEHKRGEFTPLAGPMEVLGEIREMVAHFDLKNSFFTANHISNYLPIRARLPEDKSAVLKLIDQALAGEIDVKPDWMRGGPTI